MKAKFLFSLFCLLASGYALKAQDVHFSQYWESAVLRNPALVGIFSSRYKAGAIYRSQWNSLGNPYQTLAADAEGHFPLSRNTSDYLSVGLMFFSDKAGRATLKTTGIYPCLSYNKHLSEDRSDYLSLGFAAGYLQRSFDPGKLTFDNQYQGGQVVPGAGAGEELPLAKLSHFDLGAGLTYNSSVGENNFIVYVIGVSAYHFTQPRGTFALQSEQLMNLSTRWNASLGLNVTMNDVWSMEAQTNLALQGAYRELMLGGLLRWARPDEGNVKSFGLAAGAQARFGDAIIPMLRLEYKGQTFGISYDINTSPLKAATGMRGGLELTAFFKGLGGGEKQFGPQF